MDVVRSYSGACSVCVCVCVLACRGKGNTRGNSVPLSGDPQRLRINLVQLCLKRSTELIQNHTGSLAPHGSVWQFG